jgi:hypothetical protein
MIPEGPRNIARDTEEIIAPNSRGPRNINVMLHVAGHEQASPKLKKN